MAVRRREHRRGHAAVRRRRNARNAAVFFAVVVARRVHRRAGGDEPYKRTSGWSSKASEAELKGVEVVGIESEEVGGEKRRERKSLRIGVHHAIAVVWGPV